MRLRVVLALPLVLAAGVRPARADGEGNERTLRQLVDSLPIAVYVCAAARRL